MLKDAVGIRLQGANFKSSTNLKIFTHTSIPKICLLYGKNGTGKSTISRAYNVIKGVRIPERITAELLDKDENPVSISPEDAGRIFVFNEDYINLKVNFDTDGLDTIIILGELNNIEQQLKETRKKKLEAETSYKNQEKKCLKYYDENDSVSPDYYITKMTEALRGKGNWAVRKQEIMGSSTAAKVSATTYTQIISLRPLKNRDTLIIDYDKKFQELSEAKSGAKIIETKVNIISELIFDENQFLKLLAKEIEKPELSEREKFLIELVADKRYGIGHVESIRTFFSNGSNKRCPFCLQNVNPEDRKELLNSISQTLSKASEEHREELEKCRLDIYDCDLSAYEILDETLLKRCSKAIEDYNNVVKMINENIDTKKENIYTPIDIENFDIKGKYDRLVEALNALETARTEYNKNASNPKPIQQELQKINDELAYYDIEGLYKEYIAQSEKKKNEEEIRDALKSTLSLITKEVEELEAQKKNVYIARDDINAGLKYIFFNTNRLSIDIKDGKYIVLSRGESVRPKDISVGERNAISLCYFFSDIMSGKEQDIIYNDEYMLVIDDPISSFDIENKVGILSLLKFYLNRFVKGNPETKVLIMTHDIQTYYDIEKLLGEILCAASEQYRGRCTAKISFGELSNEQIVKINKDRGHEYTYLLETMYEYAQGTLSADYLDIGNAMRRVVEAFGTFEFKEGVAELSTKSFLLKRIENEKLRDYFEHLMYRLVLNEESHTKNSVKSLSNMDFFNYIAKEDKQRTAKDVLCLLYSLNKEHVFAHLKKKNGAIESIKEWISEIELDI